MNTTHTPTPWRRHDMEHDSIVGPDRKAIALVMGRSRSDSEDAANLALIVEAVNSYASDRAEIKALRSALSEARPACEYLADNGTDHAGQWAKVCKQIETALSLGGGK